MIKMNMIISVFEYWETYSLAAPSVVRVEVYFLTTSNSSFVCCIFPFH